MSRSYETPPVGASTPPTRREGAIVRDVAVDHEPRVLPVRAVVPRPAPEGRDRREWVGGRGGPGEDVLAEAAGAYQAGAAEATAYQRGYEAGRTDAESAWRERSEEAVRQGWKSGFEQGRVEGRERGLEEGREEGRREAEEARKAALAAAEERLERIHGLLESLERQRADHVEAAEEELLALCHSIVCRVLGDQAVTREAVGRVVARAIQEAGGRTFLEGGGKELVAVHLHPRDLELLEGRGEGASPAPGNVRWVSDESVALGGCLVRSPAGTLDARFETQLETLRGVLKAARSRVPSLQPTGSPDSGGAT